MDLSDLSDLRDSVELILSFKFEDLGDSIGMPPPPVVTSRSAPQQQQQQHEDTGLMSGPQAANGVLGGSFGSFF